MKDEQQCSWIDEETNKQCDEETDQICMCCAMPICYEHQSQGRCPFGGMGMIEV